MERERERERERRPIKRERVVVCVYGMCVKKEIDENGKREEVDRKGDRRDERGRRGQVNYAFEAELEEDLCVRVCVCVRARV